VAVDQLVHQTLFKLPEDFIQGKGAYLFVIGVKGYDPKQYLFTGGRSRSMKPVTRA
jgi:hypothetical protein